MSLFKTSLSPPLEADAVFPLLLEPGSGLELTVGSGFALNIHSPSSCRFICD